MSDHALPDQRHHPSSSQITSTTLHPKQFDVQDLKMSLTLSFADASVAQFVISEKDTSFCVLTRYTALPEVGNG